MFKVPEDKRIKGGQWGSTRKDGNNGSFFFQRNGVSLLCLASDMMNWEHVSVSMHSKGGKKPLKRTPTWDEMCFIKDTFWDKDDTVIQFHPAEIDYVDCHPYCLHLWKPIEVNLPKPPIVMV